MDIIATPYEWARAEWARATSNNISVLEIDREASSMNPILNDEEKAYVRTAQMGGGMARKCIAEFNEDIDNKCTYCNAADSTTDHTIFECDHFKEVREATDPKLAAVPIKYISKCLRCGLAPAMKVEGQCTHWGQQVDHDEAEETKKLLGIDLSLIHI